MRELHGMVKHPLYIVWRNMRARCYRPAHPQFELYGGRGISVCDSWRKSFNAFLTDMGATYSPGLSLDRINNNGDYSVENCRWTDRKTQQDNRRCTRRIYLSGETILLKDACEKNGFKYNTVLRRALAGWPDEDLFAPLKKRVV